MAWALALTSIHPTENQNGTTPAEVLCHWIKTRLFIRIREVKGNYAQLTTFHWHGNEVKTSVSLRKRQLKLSNQLLVTVQPPCSLLWGKSLWDDPSAFRCLFLSMKPTSFAWLTGRHNPSYGVKSCPIWDLKRKPIKIWNCNSVLWHWQEAELRALCRQNSNKESRAFLLQPLPVFFVSVSVLVCLSESGSYSVAQPGLELMRVLLPPPPEWQLLSETAGGSPFF